MKDTRNPENRQSGEKAEGTPPAKEDVKSESEMLANPPRSLDRIAKTISESDYRNAGLDSEVEIAPSLKPDKSNPGVGDPFDPRSWDKLDARSDGNQAEKTEEKSQAPMESVEAENKGQFSASTSIKQEAQDLTRDIAGQLGKMPQQISQDVDVSVRNGGLLVSLTESARFEMFNSGSAEPKPEMLKLVEAVARALKARSGAIVIRGHTDSRPYRNKYYDNWQLSTARANLARYMLIRGGVEEQRIRRVEGVADLEPTNSRDPQAPENRRIEIFIAEEQP